MPMTAPSLEQVVRPTTLIDAVRLNSKTGLQITLASETFQVTGSFKFRAAYNLAANSAQEHLIAASSGNFGQALAYACKLLGKNCTIVMPDNSAQVKIDAVREFGGIVDLINTAQISRSQRVRELAAADPGAATVSAYDDPRVIAGNASLGRELAAVRPRFDAVLVPIGGGGLASGIVQGLKESSAADVKVYGVEPLLANDAAQSLRAGRIISFEREPLSIADGARTLSMGKHNWAILQNSLAGILEVSEDAITEAVRALFSLANLKAEPTGALTLAGALANKDLFEHQRICCVVSGGNVDLPVFLRLIGNS